MSDPTCLYTQLTYENYKRVEQQMKEFQETVHKSHGGFYHTSVRIIVSKGLVMEFHGPLVKAAEKENGT